MKGCAGYVLFLMAGLAQKTSSQQQLTALDPEYVLNNGQSVTFNRNGDRNLYGNNVSLRTSDIPDAAQRVWVDIDSPLPASAIKRFYVYVTNKAATVDAQSQRVRLQIWRPEDLSVPRLSLVWQQLVILSPNLANGSLYSFKINGTVVINGGDRIGWTCEGSYGLIVFDYVNLHHTYFSRINISSTGIPTFPTKGTSVTFDLTYLPSLFSISVELDSSVVIHGGGNATFGNNCTLRSTYSTSGASRSWFDFETVLPEGTITTFYMYIPKIESDVSIDSSSYFIRLQIWRPLDLTGAPRMTLVWQQRVQIPSYQGPVLQTYSITGGVSVLTGDRIGWMFEGSLGLISFDYINGHRTFRYLGAMPQIGQTISFDSVYVPSIFSIAVQEESFELSVVTQDASSQVTTTSSTSSQTAISSSTPFRTPISFTTPFRTPISTSTFSLTPISSSTSSQTPISSSTSQAPISSSTSQTPISSSTSSQRPISSSTSQTPISSSTSQTPISSSTSSQRPISSPSSNSGTTTAMPSVTTSSDTTKLQPPYLPATVDSPRSNNSIALGAGIGGGVGLLIIILVVAVVAYYCEARRRKMIEKRETAGNRNSHAQDLSVLSPESSRVSSNRFYSNPETDVIESKNKNYERLQFKTTGTNQYYSLNLSPYEHLETPSETVYDQIGNETPEPDLNHSENTNYELLQFGTTDTTDTNQYNSLNPSQYEHLQTSPVTVYDQLGNQPFEAGYEIE